LSSVGLDSIEHEQILLCISGGVWESPIPEQHLSLLQTKPDILIPIPFIRLLIANLALPEIDGLFRLGDRQEAYKHRTPGFRLATFTRFQVMNAEPAPTIRILVRVG
jgi:hypothetical protein